MLRTAMNNKKVGKIIQLFISVKDENAQTQTIKQETIYLDHKGVKNDKFYNTDLQRSILIGSLESYQLAKENNIQMDYGSLGENILMDFSPYHLNVGERIQIGDLTLEITQNCTLCKGLAKVDPKAPKLLKAHRGIFAKTVTDGSINNGDPVYL